MRFLTPIAFISFIGICSFFGICAFADTVSVSYTSPTSGSSHTSGSFSVSAHSSDTGGYALTGWVVSVKNNSTGAMTDLYNNSSVGSSLSTTICFAGKISSGNYTVYLKAWDAAGTEGQATVTNVNLSGSSCSGGGSGGIPTPPSGSNFTATTWSGSSSVWLDAAKGWTAHTGGEAACPSSDPNCSAGSKIANYKAEAYVSNSTYSIPTLSGSDGKSALFQLLTSPSYSDLLYGRSLGARDSAKNFLWDFRLYAKTQTYQNLEYDMWQTVAGQRYMMGTQCNSSTQGWDGWDEYNQHWIHIIASSGNGYLKCPKFSTNTWHRIRWYVYADKSTKTYGYYGVEIDGVYHNLVGSSAQEPSGAIVSLQGLKPHSSTWPDNVGIQVQIDADSSGHAFSEWLDLMQFWGW